MYAMSGVCCLGGPNCRRAVPNNKGTVSGSDCLWRSCTEHRRCHISPAASRQRRRRSPFPPRSLRLNRCRRQPPRRSRHVPPLIQVLRLPERLAQCLRQRYQPQRHSPPARETGYLSPAVRKSDSTDRHLERTHTTCAARAWPRTTVRLDRYRRIPRTLSKKRPTTRQIF
jgi:hypothetical protein